jgi:hypothetical protein
MGISPQMKRRQKSVWRGKAVTYPMPSVARVDNPDKVIRFFHFLPIQGDGGIFNCFSDAAG